MDPSPIGQDDLSLYTTDYTNDITSQDPDYFLSSTITETSSAPIAAATTTTELTSTQSQSTEKHTSDDPTNDATLATSHLTFDKNEFSFLPQVQTIIQSILDGDNSDDIGKAVIRLNERIEQARHLLQDLPGLQFVKDEQEAILQQETAILHDMKLKLQRYSRLAAFTNGTQ